MSKNRKNTDAKQNRANQNQKVPLWIRAVVSLFGSSKKGADQTPSSTASPSRGEAVFVPPRGDEWMSGDPRRSRRLHSEDSSPVQICSAEVTLSPGDTAVGGTVILTEGGTCVQGEITSRTAVVDVGAERRVYRVICSLMPGPEGAESECRGVCEAILSPEDYDMFREILPMSRRLEDIRRFAAMGVGAREAFRLRRAQSVGGAAAPVPAYTPVTDEKTLRLLFNSCRDSYPENIRLRAEAIFRQLESSYVPQSDRVNLLLRLSMMLTVRTQAVERPTRTFDEVMEILNRRIYGMDDLKLLVAEQVMLMQHCRQTGCAILLVGSPGVGKTSVVQALAECYGVPLARVDCDGADVLTLGGLSMGWASACCGRIMDAFYQQGTTQILLNLEEIDKMTSQRDGENAYAPLIRMLGPGKQLFDRFVAEGIDVSAAIVVATANDPAAIPEYIKNRFQTVLRIPDYNAEDKLNIARDYMVPAVLEERQIAPGELAFTDGALRLMAANYTCDRGAREMRANLEAIARKAVAGWARGLLPKPFLVDESFVRDNLSPRSDPSEKRVRGFCG